MKLFFQGSHFLNESTGNIRKSAGEDVLIKVIELTLTQSANYQPLIKSASDSCLHLPPSD